MTDVEPEQPSASRPPLRNAQAALISANRELMRVDRPAHRVAGMLGIAAVWTMIAAVRR